MLLLAATPIGNLGDASPRLREALADAHVIAAEDTRQTLRLVQLLEITTHAEFIALHDHNERERASSLAERARDELVVLVSDAGMPTVSDPGYRVVSEAIRAGVEVSAIPGPSAVLTALAVSGLPTDRFAFEGFVPRKSGERTRFFERLASDARTLIFFESPARLAVTLDSLTHIFGADREAAVCRELTKRFEEVRRGSLSELAEWAQQGVRGEIVLVVAGASVREVPVADAVAEVVDRAANGERMKDAAREVAGATGRSSRELYAAALAAKREGN